MALFSLKKREPYLLFFPNLERTLKNTKTITISYTVGEQKKEITIADKETVTSILKTIRVKETEPNVIKLKIPYGIVTFDSEDGTTTILKMFSALFQLERFTRLPSFILSRFLSLSKETNKNIQIFHKMSVTFVFNFF